MTRMTEDTTRRGRSGTINAEGALSPVPLMQLATGFWAFKTLAAADEFDLFSRLSGTAGTTIEGLAEQLEIQERPAQMLLTAVSASGQRSSRRELHSVFCVGQGAADIAVQDGRLHVG